MEINKIFLAIFVILIIFVLYFKFNTTTTTVKNDEEYLIPKIIHQTFATRILPDDIITIIDNNKKLCPDCIFKFYNDEDCDIFIKNNFDDRVYKSYKTINPIYGAMKADFFRYCILYIEGGVYLDVKSILHQNIFNHIKKNDVCILDIERNYLEPWRTNNPTFEQWLLIFCKNHPYLLHMINQMIYYIDIRFEPSIEYIRELNTKQKILHVTGPDAFTKSVKDYIKLEKLKLHRNIDYNKIGIIHNFFTNYKKMYYYISKKHYSEYKEPLYI